MTPNFTGHSTYSLDTKGRLTIPAKYRSRLSRTVVVARGLGDDGCLQLFPEERWNRLAEKVNSLPLGHAGARLFRRKFLAWASESDLDRQGRIMIPEMLRNYAKLDGEVVVVGVGDHLELWNPERWEEVNEAAEEVFATIVEQLAEVGI
jgi:MraZ protein